MASPWAMRALAAELESEPRVLERSLAAQHLMASVMRAGAPLIEEYPLVFGREAPGRVALIEAASGRALSACALLARDFVVGSRRLRAGLIGSVATDPSCRGRGLASRVLQRAQQELARDGCLFVLLWAEDPAFYQARGYRSIGRELDFFVPPGRRPSFPTSAGVRLATAADVPEIHRLYSRHPSRVERTPAEMGALLAVPGMQVLVQEQAGRLQAYSCRGRGADLKGVVHEWGGAVEAVLACIGAHLEREQPGERRELVVFAAPDSAELAAGLRRAGMACASGVLGMARLLDRAGALRLLTELRPELRREALALSDELLLERLFGSGEAAPASLQPGERSELPLCPFVWGLDSI